MAHDLTINDGSKAQKYDDVIPQIEALISDEKDITANLANTAAALWQTFGFFWIGFYRVDGDELVLGPFQGPVACTRIAFGKGVCGKSWQDNTTVIVEDVDAFPGHIACSSLSRSEIVVPVRNSNGEVAYILDIDSDQLASFDQQDQQYLEKIVDILANRLQ
ncbi:GAF domain-containing protein [Agarilytica rhodophyticola]|uniref:GAF domain-containing protein n=1 Tax=Agarilytica rhodophyticola TaxID=1737490 RepID=UPI000B344DD2|nr:GAF domain-containing protein [Agarilytica rhodophyticola]